MAPAQLSPVGRVEKVLLPTDGSTYSIGAEKIAIELCAQHEAKLHVISAIIRYTETGFMGPQADEEMEKKAAAHLADVERRALEAGVEVTVDLLEGDDPYEVIVDTARSFAADLIIMGRRGRRGLARLMLGDATAKVIGHAPCGVLVVPEEAEMWKSMVLATDGSRYSDAAAVTAAELAKPTGSLIGVLSVKVPSHSERRQNEARPIVERVVDFLGQQGLRAEGIVAEGVADETIIRVARERKACLIVLGSFGRTGIGQILFGSKAERVINASKGSVLVVRGG